MSDPKPSSAVPFPLEAFAHGRARAREAEKRSLWKGLFTLLKSHDVLERASFCPITLLGLVALFVRMLDVPGIFAEAHALGLAEAKGFAPSESQPQTVPLQVVVTTEPEWALLERLSAEDFCRMTAPGVEPVIFMGHGSLSAWRAAQNNGVRITKLDLPGGTIRGMQIRLDSATEGENAGPLDASATGTGGAGSDPSASASNGEAPGISAGASGAEADRTEEPARSTAARKTQGAPASRAREAVARRSPADATTESVRPYLWAKISAPTGQKDWELHRATDAEREALMLSVVAGQGPVDLDTATEGVRLGLPVRAILTNGRTRLRDALRRLEAAGAVIRTDGDFYDLPGRPVLPRDRTGCGSHLRRLTALPPVEIDAAICEVLADGGPAEDAAVVVGAARRLGYALKSPATNPALAAIIARRIELQVDAQDKPVVRSKAGLSLAVSPTDHREGEDWAEESRQADGAGTWVRQVHDGAADDQPPVLRAAE